MQNDVHDAINMLKKINQETGRSDQEDILVTAEQGRPTVHVYILNEPLENYLEKQEYNLAFKSDSDSDIQEEPITQSSNLTSTPKLKQTLRCLSRRWHLTFIICLLALLGILGGITVEIINPFQIPHASVTIVPSWTDISATGTISAVLGKVNTAYNEIHGRLLPTITLTETRTVSTTGKGHVNSQVARGLINFYNSSLQRQVVKAGTTITGADGVVIVTEQDAVIPAGNLQVNGQTHVWARAISAGPEGNIQAGDIFGPCCHQNISAANDVFTGGQVARDFPMVKQEDINIVKEALLNDMARSIMAVMQDQVHLDETLVTPLPCAQQITSDHLADVEAAQVSTTVQETCTGETYSTQDFSDLVKLMVSQEARKQLGEGYALVGNIRIIIDNRASQKEGSIQLRVKGIGTWVYQFSQRQLDNLATQIAGKSKAQATHILLRLTTVQTLSINIISKDSSILPNDPKQIRFLLLYTNQ